MKTENQEIAVISIYSPRASLHGSWASGVGSYTKNLLTHMDDKIREKILILTEVSDKTPREVYQEDGILINRCRERKRLFGRMSQILTALKKYPKIKTIHIQHEFNMFGSAATIPLFLVLLFFLRKYRLIVTYHGVVDTSTIDEEYGEINSLPSFLPPFLLRFCFWFFYKVSSWFIDKVIVHEDYFKKVLMNYGFKENQVEVIPHGVEELTLSLTKQEARAQLNIAEGKKVLLYFWFLAGYKGVDLLLDGFEKLDPSEYCLILAWGAPKRTLADPRFKQWYDSVNHRAETMPGVIRMWGFVADEMIPVLYAASDMLMIPYLYMLAASGPMALALAYNLPFLVSEVFAPVITDECMRFEKTSESLKKRVEIWYWEIDQIQELVAEMREQRLWSKISEITEKLYC